MSAAPRKINASVYPPDIDPSDLSVRLEYIAEYLAADRASYGAEYAESIFEAIAELVSKEKREMPAKNKPTREKRGKTISLRITDEFRQKVEDAQNILPYAPTVTAIIERGIELAIAEIHQLATLLKDRQH